MLGNVGVLLNLSVLVVKFGLKDVLLKKWLVNQRSPGHVPGPEIRVSYFRPEIKGKPMGFHKALIHKGPRLFLGIMTFAFWIASKNSWEEFVDGYLRCKPCNKAVDEHHLSTAALFSKLEVEGAPKIGCSDGGI